jgi:hypothetical protein
MSSAAATSLFIVFSFLVNSTNFLTLLLLRWTELM